MIILFLDSMLRVPTPGVGNRALIASSFRGMLSATPLILAASQGKTHLSIYRRDDRRKKCRSIALFCGLQADSFQWVARLWAEEVLLNDAQDNLPALQMLWNGNLRRGHWRFYRGDNLDRKFHGDGLPRDLDRCYPTKGERSTKKVKALNHGLNIFIGDFSEPIFRFGLICWL